MSCKKKPVTKKMVRITMEAKKEIVEKYESGMRIRELSAAYRMPRTTVSTIIKNKEVIKSANVAKGVKSITKQRSKTLEHVEKLLLIWITEMQRAGDSISEAMICEKAKIMHADLLKNTAGTSRENETFKASHGWFDNFKKRTGLHGVVRQGADKVAAQDFVLQFSEFVQSEGFVPEQVFNCDETVLFWKKMPHRTFITQGDNIVTGEKPMKERLTILLCGNASGDYKVKPLLVYYSENSRDFKKHNIQKSQLPIMWKSNSNARITREYFSEWFNFEFGPGVKNYLERKNLPPKAFLVMDNAPTHPPSLQDYILPEFGFITVKFLPPNTTALIQPMNQQIISNFKKLYTKALFQMCYEVTSDTETTLGEFWKEFTIIHCVTLIHKAWQEVSRRTMNSAWRNLWPEAVTEELESLEAVSTVEDIVSLGRSMGLDVSDCDVEELVDGHSEELTTKDLQELENIEEKNKQSVISPNSEEEMREVPTALIQEILSKWMDVKNFAEKYHPNKGQTSRNIIAWNDQIMLYFRNILKRRDRFVTKVESREQPGPASWKKRKSERETTPEFLVPEVLLEIDFNQ